MNFYLIDKVKEIKVGKSASGIKCWSLDNLRPIDAKENKSRWFVDKQF